MTNMLIIGGQTTDFTELYHYTDSRWTEISSGTYWTTYKTDKSSDAKVMTGSTYLLHYRLTVRVNNKVIDQCFSDAGTKWGPNGYGAALEFRNKARIQSGYFGIDRIS